MSFIQQAALQFDTAAARHPNIRYQAAGLLEAIGLQEILRSSESLSCVAVRFQKALGGLAHGGVIVDD